MCIRDSLYNENKPSKYIRNWGSFLFWNPTWDFDGNPTYMGVGSITVAELPNFWNYFIRFDWRPRVYDPGLTRGGPVARAVEGGGSQIQIDTDRRKRYTAGLYARYSYNVEGGRGVSFQPYTLSLIHISEPTRLLSISHAVFCLKK